MSKSLEKLSEQEQTYDICLRAINKNPYELGKVINQIPKLCYIAIDKDPFVIDKVSRACVGLSVYNDLCMYAIKKNGLVLRVMQYIQTLEICLAAVQQNGMALKYVKKEFITHDLCVEAVKQNICALNWIEINLCLAGVTLNTTDININHINKNFIRNILKHSISIPDVIRNYFIQKYNKELVPLLQQYDYAFSKDMIVKTILMKTEVPYVHQYGYDMNDPEFINAYKKSEFYPSSYNIDPEKIE